MLDTASRWLGRLDGTRALWYGVGLALAIEFVTIVFRFGLGLTSPQSTSWMAAYTGGWRIHHGYPGVLALLVVPFLGGQGALRNLCIIVGIGLVLSDLVHHFVVLQLVTGHHEFYLRYD